jgi:hypothetical protein
MIARKSRAKLAQFVARNAIVTRLGAACTRLVARTPLDTLKIAGSLPATQVLAALDFARLAS